MWPTVFLLGTLLLCLEPQEDADVFQAVLLLCRQSQLLPTVSKTADLQNRRFSKKAFRTQKAHFKALSARECSRSSSLDMQTKLSATACIHKCWDLQPLSSPCPALAACAGREAQVLGFCHFKIWWQGYVYTQLRVTQEAQSAGKQRQGVYGSSGPAMHARCIYSI